MVEKITLIGYITVTMGYEINQPEKTTDNSGKIVTKRLTDIWLKGKSSCQIIARQSTIINIK